MFVANQLMFSHAGRRVFRELGLSVSTGELMQVTGMSGSGKATLSRVLYGLLAPTSGSFTWYGAPVHSGGAAFLNALCYIGHANDIDLDPAVAESLRLVTQSAELPVSATEPFGIGFALEAFELGKLATTSVYKLS